MTDKREKDKQAGERVGDEADSTEDTPPAKQPDDQPESNLLPRQIDDDQDATWFLTP